MVVVGGVECLYIFFVLFSIYLQKTRHGVRTNVNFKIVCNEYGERESRKRTFNSYPLLTGTGKAV